MLNDIQIRVYWYLFVFIMIPFAYSVVFVVTVVGNIIKRKEKKTKIHEDTRKENDNIE